MIKDICIWTVILTPLIRATISITKECYDKSEKEKSAGIVASIIVCIVIYGVYYYAGIFDLLK